MIPRVSGLGPRFPPALVPSTAHSLLAGQSVRTGGFGGVGRILPARRQLPFQIRALLFLLDDLLRLLGDLFVPFGYLLAAVVNLPLQLLELALRFFAIQRLRKPMLTRTALLVACTASGFRTHPPYVKRFREICPAKSTRVTELLQIYQQQLRQRVNQVINERWCFDDSEERLGSSDRLLLPDHPTGRLAGISTGARSLLGRYLNRRIPGIAHYEDFIRPSPQEAVGHGQLRLLDRTPQDAGLVTQGQNLKL